MPGARGLSRILVVNAGASSLKVALFEAGAKGTPCLRRATRMWGSGEDREAITKAVLGEIGTPPDVVGHRVVHGGAAFRRPVCVDAQVEAAIESLIPLAPLHNPAALQAIRTSREVFSEAPCVAVFDTAFHAERPPVSMHYALPEELTGPLQIRRYGFHGIAHAALVEKTADAEGIAASEVTAVTLQLGAGCSACAVSEGRSIETSMGFTPLEGLVMATRCGSIDPAIVVQLVRRGFDAARIEEALTASSGLRALAGSSDVREVLAAEAKGDERARFALQCFVHHIILTVGAYFTLLNGRGSLVFGGGIGRNSAEIRRRVASGLAAWDVVLDDDCNARNPTGRISRAGHRPVFVFETDEERVIARQVAELFGSAWHAISPEAALAHCGTSRSEGLSAAEATRRLAQYGPNRLPETKPRSALRRLVEQFRNLLIYVLLGSAAITAALGHAVDTAVILGVVIINALVGFVQEGRAEKALDAIRGMLAPKASVLRDRRRITVRSAEVVPGDLVLLEAGDRVPADLRLVRARNLRVQEAMLTGESVPVEKSSAPVAPDIPPGDRSSIAFSGTLIAAGQGTGVAVATGSSTELGRISTLIGAVETLTTPLLRQMDRFARWLTGAILGVSGLVYAVATLIWDFGPGDAFLVTVGLAVAAIPEGLPAVLTIALARGVHRMAVQNAIIRRLPAVETLGSVSVICTDKTGTLTRNEMTVRAVVTAAAGFEVSGVGYEPRGAFRSNQREVDAGASPALSELARAGLLCNDASLRQTEAGWIVEGDPMEGALVSLAVKAGNDPDLVTKQFPRSDEIPFDARHRFMATLHHSHENGAFLYVKGAPERVLEMCEYERGIGGDAPLNAPFWHRQVESLASEGQRVLAVAVKRMPTDNLALTFSDAESGLVFLGLLGLMDPPRQEAIAAVRDCRTAGIRVKMITGDHTATARAIASQLGLENTQDVATGQALDALDDGALRQLVQRTDIFARTSPEHKLRLVQALQAEGAVVAMTGDGVNDAPALKRADVGIAMGRKGTESAKEAAEMVLADDNFASIAIAVREGRTVYDNLKKVIAWTLPTNGGEALSIIVALLFGLTLPITPVQILWINMVTVVALGLTLVFEPTEPDTMRRPPRRTDEPLLSGFLLWRVVFVSILFLAGIFGTFTWALERGLPLEEARTIAANEIVVMEIFYLFSVRYLRFTSLTSTGVLGTPAVLIGVGTITALQLAFTYLPSMQMLFGTRAVALEDGAAIVAIGVALLLLLEIEKMIRRGLGLDRRG